MRAFLALLRKMRGTGMIANVISFSAAISARGQWQQASTLLRKMRETDISANVISLALALHLAVVAFGAAPGSGGIW